MVSKDTSTSKFGVHCALLFILAAPTLFPGNSISLVSEARAQALSSSLQFKVNKLAANIEKTRQSIASQGTAAIADNFKAKQLRDRISSYGAGLAKMPSKDDPVLMAAKQKYALLVADYNALVNSGSTPAQTQQSNTANTTNSTAPNTQQTANTTSNNSDASGKQLVSGQRVRVKKLTRDIASMRGGIVTTGPSKLQNANEVARYQKAMEKYATALKRYGDYKTDPDVISAINEYVALREALSTEFQRAKSQQAELGDVQTILATIENNLTSSVIPKMMWKPISSTDATQFVDTIAQTKQIALASIQEIERIAPTANLEQNNPGTVQQGAPYDRNDMNRLFRWAHDNIKKSDEALSGSIAQLENEFQFQDQHELNYFRALDPEEPKYRMNAFLKEGAEAEIYQRLDQQLSIPASLAALQKATDGQVSPQVEARINEIHQLRKTYAENRVKAVGDSKLPDPVSTDAERLAIAKEVLAVPRFEFGEHGPVVLTTKDIVTRTETVSRDTIKEVDISLSGELTWSGTRETWNYEWDEFKFATPLKHDNGDWYIWWITAKYYRSGASTTPLNAWVSGKSTQGDLILEKNFR